MVKRPQDLVFRYLSNDAGVKNAVGNYSISPEEFYCQATHYTNIERLIIHIEDTFGMVADEYGNIGNALTNGYSVKILKDNDKQIIDLCDNVLIKTNAGIGRYCYDVDIKSWGLTPTNEFLNARWTFSKSGSPIILAPGQKLSITLNDDFSDLISHYFMIQGFKEQGQFKYV